METKCRLVNSFILSNEEHLSLYIVNSMLLFDVRCWCGCFGWYFEDRSLINPFYMLHVQKYNNRKRWNRQYHGGIDGISPSNDIVYIYFWMTFSVLRAAFRMYVWYEFHGVMLNGKFSIASIWSVFIFSLYRRIFSFKMKRMEWVSPPLWNT